MRRKSHISLGRYLTDRYMTALPGSCRKAFLLGCIQPDTNPATYLKGSLRYQWLRGHNYQNSHRFLRRISRRLEGKSSLSLFDYYTLGKLIHYTADAFTFAHNAHFPGDLRQHRSYEADLQKYFLPYLQQQTCLTVYPSDTILEGIRNFHQSYRRKETDIRRDSRYALRACCCIFAVLLHQ